MTAIFVDADACPVREEIYRVAARLSLDVLGPDRILFAADHPYESVEEAVTFLDTVSLPDDVRAKLYWQNALRVFKLG